MSIKINWVRTNPGDSPSEGAYWCSVEGRFRIEPTFRSTTWPSGYKLTDNHIAANFDSIRECKMAALRRVEKELKLEVVEIDA